MSCDKIFMDPARIPVIKQEMECVYNIESAAFNTFLSLNYLLRFSNNYTCTMEIVTAYKYFTCKQVQLTRKLFS